MVSGATRHAEPAAGSPPHGRPASRGTSATRRAARRWRPNLPGGIGVAIWLAVVGVPLYTLIATTFQPSNDYIGSLAWPARLTLANYATVFGNGFVTYLVNTVIVTLAAVAIVVVLVVPIGYVIVRSRGWRSGLAFRVFVLGLAIPAQATIIPLYLLITRMHLYDTLLAIILPTAAFSMPVCVLILTGSMRDIPEDLYEAMALDGASPARMLMQLVIPLARGGIATAAIYTALLQAWNGFLFPLILTQSDNRRVLTLGLYNYIGQFRVDIPALLAAVVLSGVPIFAAYLLARRALINSLVGVGGR
jgi:xylobiose transport system permease protein